MKNEPREENQRNRDAEMAAEEKVRIEKEKQGLRDRLKNAQEQYRQKHEEKMKQEKEKGLARLRERMNENSC